MARHRISSLEGQGIADFDELIHKKNPQNLEVLSYTVEPRFNEVAGDRPNLFVKIEGSLYRKSRYNELEGKRPKCSLYRGHS